MRGIIHFLCYYYTMLFFEFVLCYIHSLKHSTTSSYHKLSIMKTINYDTTINYHDIQYSIGINRYSSVYKKERIGRYLLRLKGSSNDEVINKTRMKTNSNNTNKRRKMNNNNNDTGNRYKVKEAVVEIAVIGIVVVVVIEEVRKHQDLNNYLLKISHVVNE